MQRKELIEKRLKEYFPLGAIIEVTVLGVISHIEVTYTDGPSVAEARRWIDNNIADVANITLWRDYSDEVLHQTLTELYDIDPEVQARVEAMLISQSFTYTVEDPTDTEIKN